MNKSAIVTGVAGGIGYATAAKLLDNGFSVTGMDIAPETGRELKGDFTYFSGDFSQRISLLSHIFPPFSHGLTPMGSSRKR